jgi:hypothetical protein
LFLLAEGLATQHTASHAPLKECLFFSTPALSGDDVARGYHGIRTLGTNVPGVIAAGTFYQDGKRVFWDVHHPEKTIVIDLHDERYNELVVEVADPEAAVRLIQNAL